MLMFEIMKRMDEIANEMDDISDVLDEVTPDIVDAWVVNFTSLRTVGKISIPLFDDTLDKMEHYSTTKKEASNTLVKDWAKDIREVKDYIEIPMKEIVPESMGTSAGDGVVQYKQATVLKDSFDNLREQADTLRGLLSVSF